MKNKSYLDFQPNFKWLIAHPLSFLAYGFGMGLSKYMPGTIGSLLGVVVAWLLVYIRLPLKVLLVFVFILFLLGIWSADVTEKRIGVADASGVVIDEIVAILLILFLLPFTWQAWLAAFILFRFFDILKPFPIGWFDKHVHGGFGTMLDDLIAVPYVILLILIFYELKLT